MITKNRVEHAMVDTGFSVKGVDPYPLPLRLWDGMPIEARAVAFGGGLGLGYVGLEPMDAHDDKAGIILSKH